MIRFAETATCPESGSSFFVRRVITSGTFSEIHAIRFVGLPAVSTSGGGRRTDAVKLEMIRFVEITVFS
jgi:hypothetical protein